MEKGWKLKNVFDIGPRLFALLLALICLAFFLVQLTETGNMPWDNYEEWRQSDTYSLACNYYQYNMNPLLPQFNYDGASENYIQLELQIVPYASALIFKLIGGTTPVVPRLFSALLYIGAALYLAFIAKEFTNRLCAIVCTLVFLTMPLSLLLGHAIMPEACALFFYCGSLWYLLKWQDGGRDSLCIISAVYLSLSIMQKLPVAYMGLLVLMVFIWKKQVGSKMFFLYGLISLVPCILYYVYAGSVAKFDFVSGIATKHAFTEEIFSLFSPEGYGFFREMLPGLIGWVPLLGAFCGFIAAVWKKKGFLVFWTLSIGLEMATIVAMIRFGYYMAFFLPVVAVLSAFFVHKLLESRLRLAVPLVCLLTLWNTLNLSVPRWQRATEMIDSVSTAGEIIAKYVPEGDSIAIASINPVYMNAANRRGWRANIDYYDYIPNTPAEELQWFIEQGADYFVYVDGYIYGDSSGEYKAYLSENFPLYKEEGNCVIYSLK